MAIREDQIDDYVTLIGKHFLGNSREGSERVVYGNQLQYSGFYPVYNLGAGLSIVRIQDGRERDGTPKFRYALAERVKPIGRRHYNKLAAHPADIIARACTRLPMVAREAGLELARV